MQELVFSVRQIQEAPLDLDFCFDTESILERMGDLVEAGKPSEVHGHVHVEKLRGAILVEGTIFGTLFTACSRCLESARISADGTFRLVLMPRPVFPKGEIELAEDDLDTAYYTGEQIDLKPHLWDHIILSIPQQPLCTPDCRGIDAHVPGVTINGDFACESGFSVLKTLSLSPDPADPERN